jgi:triosephosphate isomerase
MRLPVIILNFKAYPEVLGHAGIELARTCFKVAEATGASIAIAPAMPDLARIAGDVNLPVLSQHFDPVLPGSRTGWTPLKAVEEAGAVGTLLNHSERKMRLGDLKLAVQMCGEAGMESVVCADTIDEAKKVARLHPEYVAIEPPDLIGGDISVTTAKPEIVTDAVEAVRKVDSEIGVLCGAGVKSREDVRKALELGTVGVLLASGVVKAHDPRKALMDLAKGLTRS